MPFLKTYWPHLAAILSGVLLAFSFAPWDLSGFLWIWVCPLLATLWFAKPQKEKTPRWLWGLGMGYLSGLGFFLTSLHWFIRVSDVGESIFAGIGAWIGICGYLAFYFAVFGAFSATVGRWTPKEPEPESRTSPPSPFALFGKADLFDQSIGVLRASFLNAAAWCGLEWLRGIALTGFAWNGLGVGLSNQLLLAQFADTVGVIGMSFFLMFSGCILFATIVRLAREVQERKRLRPHFDFAVGVAVIIALFLYGISKMTNYPEKTIDLRARIMQMNVPLQDKWSEDKDVLRKIVYDYRDLTKVFIDTGDYDLILWPETSLPGYFTFPWVQELLNDEILQAKDFYLLAGLEDYNLATEEIYNAIFLLKGNTESYQMYRKVHLVPFGEFIPFRGKFPIFEWILGGIIEQDFTRGESFDPLVMYKDEHDIGVIPLICFEDTLGRHCRKFIRPGPQVMVNVTNDGWFDNSPQPVQHFANARLRCIEMRRPMIRAANTGVSGFIDETGSIYDRISNDNFPQVIRDEETGHTQIRGSLPATVRLDPNPPITIYAKIGDSFSVAMGIVALIFSAVAIIRHRKRST